MDAELSPARLGVRTRVAVYMTACVFFLFSFWQRVFIAVITDILQRDFHADTEAVGLLAASYYYAYAGLQIVSVLFVDWFGVVESTTLMALLSVVGSLLFALASDLWLSAVGRALVGGSTAAVFITIIKICNMCFPKHTSSLIGVGVFSGFIGSILGQAPVAAAVEAGANWRALAVASTCVPCAVAVFFGALWLRNYRRTSGRPPSPLQAELAKATPSSAAASTSTGVIHVGADSASKNTNGSPAGPVASSESITVAVAALTASEAGRFAGCVDGGAPSGSVDGGAPSGVADIADGGAPSSDADSVDGGAPSGDVASVDGGAASGERVASDEASGCATGPEACDVAVTCVDVRVAGSLDTAHSTVGVEDSEVNGATAAATAVASTLLPDTAGTQLPVCGGSVVGPTLAGGAPDIAAVGGAPRDHAQTLAGQTVSTVVDTASIGATGAADGTTTPEVPSDALLKASSGDEAAAAAGVLQRLRQVITNPAMLVICVYGFFNVATLNTFASLWAPSFLEVVHGMDRETAAVCASAVLFGWGLGSPALGFISDRVPCVRVLLIAGILGTASMACAVYVPSLPIPVLFILLLFSGFATPIPAMFGAVLLYNPKHLQSVGSAVMNTCIMANGAVFQPLVATMLRAVATPQTEGDVQKFPARAYDVAMAIYPLSYLCATAAALWLTCHPPPQPASTPKS